MSKPEPHGLASKLMTAVGAIGLVAGLTYGAAVGISAMQVHNSYAKVHNLTLADMTDVTVQHTVSIRSAVMQGMLEQAGETRAADRMSAWVNKAHSGHVEAGRSLQAEHDFSASELIQLADTLIDGNFRLFRFIAKNDANRMEALSKIAVLEGFLEAAEGKIELDERLVARIKEVTANAPADRMEAIAKYRLEAKQEFSGILNGLDHGAAELQNILNKFPSDKMFFRSKFGTAKGPLLDMFKENASHVAVLDTDGLQKVTPDWKVLAGKLAAQRREQPNPAGKDVFAPSAPMMEL